MYAIVQTGGKQYRVKPGDVIRVEKLEGVRGATVEFKDVLMVVDETNNSVTVGTPRVAHAVVIGEIQRQAKSKKIIVFKHRRRKGYRKKTGHRQQLTEVRITTITT
ncbi:MAG: 50S ribosomal protein L21 [Desulfobacterota bacterium]|nr:50S ribosomal protein L21 [Thermodesulfobacteriota bacterium]